MTSTVQPLSRLNTPLGARVFLGGFFGIFLVMGLAFGWMFAGRAIMGMVQARGWNAASCEILTSRVVESSGSDGSTYRVAVTYRYDVDGRAFTGDRYKFVPGSSSGSSGKLAIVDRLRPGTRTPCWVNPAHPAEAVIDRGPTADLWFGLIPLLFIFIGGMGVLAALLGRGPMSSRFVPKRLPPTHVSYANAPDRGMATRLLPIQSRRVKFIGLTVIALFWNGGVAFFLAMLWQSGGLAWLLALFLVPFVIVGVVIVVFAVHQALGYFNPIPLITVSSPAIPLGGELKVTWAIDGKTEKLRRLSIVLEGREQATYRRGTTNTTDTHVFTTLTLADHVAPVEFSGSSKVTIPERSMHTFQAPSNKVVWVIRVRGDIANWPDSDDEFPLTVTPRTR